jgi:6-phosphogluconolactonase (cycloisomerase 2 family)
MPIYMYVSLQDEDRILLLAMDAETGHLGPQSELPAAGGPSPLTIGPDRQVLYVGYRTVPAISSFLSDADSGALTPSGTVAPGAAPTFLATDCTGRFLLSAYYQGAHVAVHPLGEDGAVGAPPCDTLATAMGVHAIQTDPSNRFAFVPHIARFNDNVLEPLRESTGPNAIWQLRFDARTGRLSPNTPLRVEPATRLGPRHYCFHPTLPVVYFSNEQGCSVTAYRLDQATGTLAAYQTLTTLPEWATRTVTCRLAGCCRPVGGWDTIQPSPRRHTGNTPHAVGARDPGAPCMPWLTRGSYISWHALMPMPCNGWPTGYRCREGRQSAMVRRDAWPASGPPCGACAGRSWALSRCPIGDTPRQLRAASR